MKPLLFAFGLAFAGLEGVSADNAPKVKTDLAHDVHVEYSVTNFVLTASAPKPSGKGNVAFDLSVPVRGVYKLVCFVDGKPINPPADFRAPGTFELSTRGLAPGSYRITLQLIDPEGGVGRATKTLHVK